MQNAMDSNNAMLLHNAIMNNGDYIITIKDLDLKYTAVNNEFLKILGLNDISEVINKNINEFFSPQNCRIIEKAAKQSVKTHKSKSYVLNLEKNCDEKILKSTCSPIIQNGKPQGFFSITKDETHEELLKIKLIDKICMINSLLENLPVLAYMKDRNNNYITGSKYSKKFFLEGIDVYSGNVKLNMEEAVKLMKEEDNYVINGKSAIIREKMIKSVNGKEHRYKIWKAPILDYNNEVNGLVIIAVNIDKQKKLELQKELFLATLTHDLKTPLQAQISSLSLLAKGAFGSVNKEQREILDMVIESANFMKEMLYSILSVYKYENGMVKLNKEFFNLDNLINTCIKEVHHLAQEKNIGFDYNKNVKNKMIYADESQIRRVILNVLNNAVNYAYKNTKIYFVFCEDDGYFTIKIRNTSAKIPLNISEHIFDKYVSGNDLGKRQGIGLGLYFCKKVIDAHLGKIMFNAYDTNNEFVIELPKGKIETENDILEFI